MNNIKNLQPYSEISIEGENNEIICQYYVRITLSNVYTLYTTFKDLVLPECVIKQIIT